MWNNLSAQTLIRAIHKKSTKYRLTNQVVTHIRHDDLIPCISILPNEIGNVFCCHLEHIIGMRSMIFSHKNTGISKVPSSISSYNSSLVIGISPFLVIFGQLLSFTDLAHPNRKTAATYTATAIVPYLIFLFISLRSSPHSQSLQSQSETVWLFSCPY